MKYLFGIFLIAHGIAHIVGFIVSFKIAKIEDVTYKTTLLAGRFDVGDKGMRVMGALWLVPALVFMASGAGVIFQFCRWWDMTFYISVFSLILCVLALPDTRYGIIVNIIVIITLLLKNYLQLQ